MILLTGATGYIGSHIWIQLLKGAFKVIGIDNLSNSSLESLHSIADISGETPTFIKGDIRDEEFLTDIFLKYSISHVVHLAALKDSNESMNMKSDYFDVNVLGLAKLLKVMRAYDCRKIIFSSSAAVYGEEAISPVSEASALKPSNYYGETKLAGERLLAEEFNRTSAISSVSLRYFNVAGWHPSGSLSESALSKSHSLFSEIQNVIQGKKEKLSIFGDDWDTEDGTPIRDYLHVSGLVKGHLDAIRLLDIADGLFTLNLGLGIGQSVFDVISAYEHISGSPIPAEVVSRRVGDIGVSYADVSEAVRVINWQPKKTLFDMCSDSFRSCSRI